MFFIEKYIFPFKKKRILNTMGNAYRIQYTDPIRCSQLLIEANDSLKT